MAAALDEGTRTQRDWLEGNTMKTHGEVFIRF